MKTIILAGGLSSRLRPLTDSVPKPMLEVGGKKILDRTLEQLAKAGIDSMTLNIGYLPEVFKQYYKDGQDFKLNIDYFVEEDLAGTAGALKKMADTVGPDPFLLIYGDNAFAVDFANIIAKPLQPTSLARIVLFDRAKSANSNIFGGAVAVDDRGMINDFIEGQNEQWTLINSGIYILSPEIFHHIPPQTVYDFGKNLFPQLLRQGHQLEAYILSPEESVFGIDTPQSLENTKHYFTNQQL